MGYLRAAYWDVDRWRDARPLIEALGHIEPPARMCLPGKSEPTEGRQYTNNAATYVHWILYFDGPEIPHPERIPW